MYLNKIVKYGDFTLKSGLKSSLYVDLRRIISEPILMSFLADDIWQEIYQLDFDYICGVPEGCTPIASIISHKYNIPQLMLRKVQKKHGTKNVFEGKYNGGDVLLLEDVITTGSSVNEALLLLRKNGITVKYIFSVVNRTKEFNITYDVRSLYDVNVLKRYVTPVQSKLLKSRLCLSADVETCDELFDLILKTSKYISCVKLHSDIIRDFDDKARHNLKKLSCQLNFVIIEDRKFLDIPNTCQLQYNAVAYADIVTVHVANANEIVPALINVNPDISILIVSDMSSFSLLSLRKNAENLCKKYDNVIGLVSQGFFDYNNKFTFTPGIRFNYKNDGKGQRYREPDCLEHSSFHIAIVGRGITESPNPIEEAKKYYDALA